MKKIKFTYKEREGGTQSKVVPWTSDNVEPVRFLRRHPNNNPDMPLQVLLPSGVIDLLSDLVEGNIEILNVTMDLD